MAHRTAICRRDPHSGHRPREWSRDEYVSFMDEHSRPFIESKALDAAAWDKFLALFEYVRVNVDRPKTTRVCRGIASERAAHLLSGNVA